MSDFDKEAERQRLREKYEKDRQKREATQRMSELLLKGATMTNRHCDTCGDPIFRYDGREFCPTCEAAGASAGGDEGVEGTEQTRARDTGGTDAGGTGATGAATDAEREAAAVEGTGPTDGSDGATDDATTVEVREAHADEAADDRADAAGSTTAAGAEADDAAAAGLDGTPASAPSAGATPTDGEATTTAERTTKPGEDVRATPDARASGRRADPAGREPERVEPATGTTGTGDAGREPTDLGGVRDSLTRTLARYVEAAEAAEDPRRAREYLAAAREAAETLAALRR